MCVTVMWSLIPALSLSTHWLCSHQSVVWRYPVLLCFTTVSFIQLCVTCLHKFVCLRYRKQCVNQGVKLGGSRRISAPPPQLSDPLPVIWDPPHWNTDPAPFCWDPPLSSTGFWPSGGFSVSAQWITIILNEQQAEIIKPLHALRELSHFSVWRFCDMVL